MKTANQLLKDNPKNVYQCPECDNSYSSASGFRGHLRKKHSLHSIKRKLYFFLSCIVRFEIYV